MTRINVVPPAELTDQHLLAEIRELPRIFTLARKRLDKHGKLNLDDIPDEYCLGAGHVKFFMVRLPWLEARYVKLYNESVERAFECNIIPLYELTDGLSGTAHKHYEPKPKDLIINRNRLRERINEKPSFYRYYGIKLQEQD